MSTDVPDPPAAFWAAAAFLILFAPGAAAGCGSPSAEGCASHGPQGRGRNTPHPTPAPAGYDPARRALCTP